MNDKVLIIDDDADLCNLIKKCIAKEGLEADVAYTGRSGLSKIENEKDGFCLVILDLMLPGMNGFEILSEIRKSSMVPILMLTAIGDELEKVTGLRLGADDYLTKPFSVNELMARTDSLIRRYTTFNQPTLEEVLTLKQMTIDKNNRQVSVNGVQADLTGKEFDLLLFLASNKGRVFTKKQIYMHVWENDYEFDDSNIMSFISKLRKKIEPDSDHPFYILTVHGVGYRFNKDA